MSETNRELLSIWWTEAWDEGLWAASWSKSLDGLTPEQAAWQPASAPGVPGKRHSIWQLVLHMIFWRESWLRRVATSKKPTPEEIGAGNFPMVSDTSQTAWDAALARFRQSQERMKEALKNTSTEAEPLSYFLPHDCYHFGQINYIRAMLGLKFIE